MGLKHKSGDGSYQYVKVSKRQDASVLRVETHGWDLEWSV
jgi:hypothetical protein